MSEVKSKLNGNFLSVSTVKNETVHYNLDKYAVIVESDSKENDEHVKTIKFYKTHADVKSNSPCETVRCAEL